MLASIYEECGIPRLSADERKARLNYFADQTFDEAMTAMSRTGKVMVVRPTGFGKTYLLAKVAGRYIKKFKGKKALYLYPNNVIRDDVLENKEYKSWGVSKDTVDFVHYNTLTEWSRENKNGGIQGIYDAVKDKYCVVILDEVHMAGAEGFREIYEEIAELFGPNGTHLIGATATPDRMDEWDVLGNVFQNSTVFPFDLADAVMEGIMQPYIHDYPGLATDGYMEALVGDFMKGKRQDNQYNEDYMKAEVRKLMHDIGGAAGYMYDMFRRTGRNLNSSTSFRFINFFKNTEDLINRGPVVEGWYEELFNKYIFNEPSYGAEKKFKMRVIYVATKSTSAGYEDDVNLMTIGKGSNGRITYVNSSEKLLKLVKNQEPYTVDLIFNINMLTMGWHVPNITGVAFLRPTKSEVLYKQQRGRALSVKDEYPALIFDFMQNATIGEGGGNLESPDEKRQAARELLGISEKDMTEAKEKLIDFLIKPRVESAVRVMDFVRKVTHPREERIVWLYTDREAPICVIAADMGISCRDVVGVLKKRKIPMDKEDIMFNHVLASGSKGLVKFLYSPKAKQYAQESLNISETLVDILQGRG